MLKPYRTVSVLALGVLNVEHRRPQASKPVGRAARSACIFTKVRRSSILPTKLDAWSWNFSPRSTWESSGLGSAAIGSHGQRTEV